MRMGGPLFRLISYWKTLELDTHLKIAQNVVDLLHFVVDQNSVCEPMESLFAKNVLDVLAVLFLHQDEAIHQSKIVNLTGLRIVQVQRALQRLLNDGIIDEHQQGNMVYYKLQPSHPLFQDLKNILYKSILIAEPFKKVFSDFSEEINIAFIYGSIATGTEAISSDIDLFLVSQIGLKKVSKLIAPIAKKLQREINPVIYSKTEFIDKVSHKDHFVMNVLHSKKLWLIGDENELSKIEKRK